MPVQIIINALDPQEAMTQMASFLGLRALEPGEAQPQAQAQVDQVQGNGADTAAAPKKTRTTRKAAEPEQQAEGHASAATVDDVRAALTEHYVNKYGMEATQKDILKLYDLVFPDGKVKKASDIPDGRHQEVIDGIVEMAEKNPFKRDRVDL